MIACNFADPTKVTARGARAYVVRINPGNGSDRIVVLARSRGGRWVEKWEAIEKLTNFRAVTLPPDHPRYGDDRILDIDGGDLIQDLVRARAREAKS